MQKIILFLLIVSSLLVAGCGEGDDDNFPPDGDKPIIPIDPIADEDGIALSAQHDGGAGDGPVSDTCETTSSSTSSSQESSYTDYSDYGDTTTSTVTTSSSTSVAACSPKIAVPNDHKTTEYPDTKHDSSSKKIRLQKSIAKNSVVTGAHDMVQKSKGTACGSFVRNYLVNKKGYDSVSGFDAWELSEKFPELAGKDECDRVTSYNSLQIDDVIQMRNEKSSYLGEANTDGTDECGKFSSHVAVVIGFIDSKPVIAHQISGVAIETLGNYAGRMGTIEGKGATIKPAQGMRC